MADPGICCVTDAASPHPTLLSVTSLRRSVAPEEAPVSVILLGGRAIDLRRRARARAVVRLHRRAAL